MLLSSVGSAAATTPSCAAGAERRVGTFTAAYAGVAKDSLTAFQRPGGAQIRTFGRLNEMGYPMTFSIVGAVMTRSCKAAWYRVQLPMRPNGSTGYIRAGEVDVQKVTTRIHVDLSERTLEFFVRGKRVIRTTVAVGSGATPTPTGRYYVNQRILTTNPSGSFGPAALGVSAFSDVLTGWAQGGPIGIHGTNRPSLLGQAISNGCIRVENRTLMRIFPRTAGGTPVVITA